MRRPAASNVARPGRRAGSDAVRGRRRGARERRRLAGRRRRREVAGPIFVARAPGRLDVMGGIADYSGALVLQWPIREATRVALSALARAAHLDRLDRPRRHRAPVRRAARRGRRRATARTTTCAPGSPRIPTRHWAAYVAGVFHVLAREHGVQLRRRRRHPHRVGRSGGQGRQLVGGDRGGDDGGGRSRAWPLTIEPQTARAALPAGREPDRRRAVRRHGSDGDDLRRSRQPHGAALPAGGAPGQRPAARRARRVGDRLGDPSRGDRRGLWGGARRRVHGLPDPRGARRAARHAGRARWPRRASTIRAGTATSPTSAATPSADSRPRSPRPSTATTSSRAIRGTTDLVTRVDPSRRYAIRTPTAHPVYEHERVTEWARHWMCEPRAADSTPLASAR